MIIGRVAQRKRWGIGVVEPVVMSEKPEFLEKCVHGSLNGLLELLIFEGQEGRHTTVARVGFGA
jgi:hypothetical protein